jgi:phosphoglycerate dehydrogenase-like enzyme
VPRIAVLDDYQHAAARFADWSRVPEPVDVVTFHDHVADDDALVRRLQPFEIVVAMRERTPFPRSTLARLPDLRLLITTGMGNKSIDLAAAAELGVTICGTGGHGPATAELTWALILAVARHVPQETPPCGPAAGSTPSGPTSPAPRSACSGSAGWGSRSRGSAGPSGWT